MKGQKREKEFIFSIEEKNSCFASRSIFVTGILVGGCFCNSH